MGKLDGKVAVITGWIERHGPGWSVYAGSKAAQQAWARVWPAELRDRRIRA